MLGRFVFVALIIQFIWAQTSCGVGFSTTNYKDRSNNCARIKIFDSNNDKTKCANSNITKSAVVSLDFLLQEDVT